VQNHFHVDVRNEGRATVLVVSGELDVASSPALEEELERACQTNAELVVLDLRELEFMDSTGLSVLVKAQRRAEAAGPRFGLINVGPQVQRLLSVSGVADWLTVVDAPEELLGQS
jgi:anti-anti-sigma factor